MRRCRHVDHGDNILLERSGQLCGGIWVHLGRGGGGDGGGWREKSEALRKMALAGGRDNIYISDRDFDTMGPRLCHD